MSGEIPSKCDGCQLTGMKAINCRIFPQVPVDAYVQCMDAHNDPKVMETSGGRYTGDARAMNGRAEGSGAHNNSGGGRRIGRKPR